VSYAKLFCPALGLFEHGRRIINKVEMFAMVASHPVRKIFKVKTSATSDVSPDSAFLDWENTHHWLSPVKHLVPEAVIGLRLSPVEEFRPIFDGLSTKLHDLSVYCFKHNVVKVFEVGEK